jgi:hypothetical protein
MRGVKSKKQQQAKANPSARVKANPSPGPKPNAQPKSQGTEQSKRSAADGYSVNALAKVLGRDRATITRAVAGLVPCRTVGKVKFFLLLDVENALRDKPNQTLRNEKLIEEIRKLRVANDLVEGKLVQRSTIQESLRRCLTPAATILEQRLVNEYPTGVAGLDVPQARIYGKRLCDELMVFLQSLESEWP